MPVRPKKKQSNWTGFKKVAIAKITDRSTEFENFDVLIDFELKVEDSEYPIVMSLLGTFEFEDDGQLKENSFLKRIYRIFDGLGDQGGVDIKGKWVDKDDKSIENIAEYLFKYININKLPYLAYIYKEKSKKDDKVYNSVYPMLVPNTSQGNEDINGYINFMLRNNYLKPYKEGSESAEGATEEFKEQF